MRRFQASSSIGIGASLSVHVRRLAEDEALAREHELVQHLTEWVAPSVSGQGIRDIDEMMRSAVWTTLRHPDRTVLLAEQDGRSTGILLGELKDDRRGRYGYVEWIAVDPDARRAGVATALVTELATTLGVERLQGSVDLDDPVASAFWERQGWTRLKPPPRRVIMGGSVIRGST